VVRLFCLTVRGEVHAPPWAKYSLFITCSASSTSNTSSTDDASSAASTTVGYLNDTSSASNTSCISNTSSTSNSRNYQSEWIAQNMHKIPTRKSIFDRFRFPSKLDHYDLWSRLGGPPMITCRFHCFASIHLLVRAN
jgi:hypothetical protein